MSVAPLLLALALTVDGQTAVAAAPVIENDRVAVSRLPVTGAIPNGDAYDSVVVYLTPSPEAVVVRRGVTGRIDPARSGIVINLKGTRLPPIENRSGHPAAFPRPGRLTKLLENDDVVVWDYAWTPGEPTPMHFHDKDVVVVYMDAGALESRTPDGQITVNEYANGDVRFNKRDRAHTERLTKGSQRAIITELK